MLTLSILGLAGCALIVVAAIADYLEDRRFTRRYGQQPYTTTLGRFK